MPFSEMRTIIRPRAVLPRASAHRRRRPAGQALIEFALVVPLMLALVGITLDFARIYQSWMRLQAVTRDTAELLATDRTYVNNTTAQAAANTRICTAMTGTGTCPASVRPGTVTVAEIGSGSGLWRATVPAEYDFQTFFLWPVIQGLTGADAWTVRTQVTYEVIRWAQ